MLAGAAGGADSTEGFLTRMAILVPGALPSSLSRIGRVRRGAETADVAVRAAQPVGTGVGKTARDSSAAVNSSGLASGITTTELAATDEGGDEVPGGGGGDNTIIPYNTRGGIPSRRRHCWAARRCRSATVCGCATPV